MELVVEGTREVEDMLEGVDVPVLLGRGTVSRSTAGLSLGLVGLEEASCSDDSEDSPLSTSSSCSDKASASASSRPFGYSPHEVCTW